MGTDHAALNGPVLEALASSPEPLAVVDARTLGMLAVTPAFAALLEVPAADLIGRSFADLYGPDWQGAGQQDPVARLHAAAAGDPPMPRFTGHLRIGGGRTLPCELWTLRLTLPDGTAVVSLTARPLLDSPAERSFHSHVIDNLPLDLAVLDAEGRYLYCNPVAVRSPEVRAGIIGRTDREYVAWRGHPPKLADQREARFREAHEGRRTVHWEEVFPTTQGDRVLRRAYSPVFRADGTLDVMLGFGSDITQSLAQTRHLGLLESMVSTSPDPLLVLDARPGATYLTVDYGNPALRRLLRRGGLGPALRGPPGSWPLPQRDRAAILALIRRIEAGSSAELLYLPDAHEWLEVTASAIRDEQGRCTHWALGLRVVTSQRRAADLQARLADANLRALHGQPVDDCLGALLGGVAAWYPGWQAAALTLGQGCQVTGDVPPRFRAMLEGAPPELLREIWERRDPNRHGRPVVFRDLHGTLSSAMPDLIEGRQLAATEVHSTVEVPFYDRGGHMGGVLFAMHRRRQAAPEGLADFLAVCGPAVALLLQRDLQRRQLEQLAFHDPLTGVMNRWTFSGRLDRELARAAQTGGQLVLGLLDLDRFKQVNDGLGHQAGDALLSSLATRLEALAQAHGVLALARMGGDEFAFLVGQVGDLTGIVQALREVFEVPFEPGGGAPLVLQASVGWSVYPDTAPDAATLHQQADAAMYTAKRRGTLSQVYEPGPQAGIQPLTLETAMRQALARREFRLVYQPQVSSSTGELFGAEALLRWTNETLGVVTPDQFIPVAELTGLMGALGAWVLETACHEAAHWLGDHLTVSVNVSSTQLQDPAFGNHVRRALHASGLDPHRLVLEVTETGLIDNPAPARAMLQALRDDGVRISIDDFGTGYSTLHSLRTLPVDELKIDRAFIQDIGDASQAGWQSRAIMRATLLLAHALDIAVVAEGVERPEQADALREVGCDLHQGWLIAPGLEAPDFEAFAREWPARLAARTTAIGVSGVQA